MVAKESLAEVLAGNWARIDQKGPAVARTYDAIVQRLSESNAGTEAPREGDVLPSFCLPDHDGGLLRSSELLSRGPVVVSMNRGHWCSFCRFELEALQGIRIKIEEYGGSIVAVTPERQTFAKKLRARCRLEFPVLCDVDNGYALALGLAVWFGEEIKPLFADIGIDLTRYQGNPAWMLPIPATFVVAPTGRIAAAFVDPDFRKRSEPKDLLTAIAGI